MRVGKQSNDSKFNVIQTPASGVDTKQILEIIGDGSQAPTARLQVVKTLMENNRNSQFFFNRREDNGAYLGLVTKDYVLVQNGELESAVEEAINLRSELGKFTKTVHVLGQGEKVAFTYSFQNTFKKLASVGDSVGFQFTVRNSFDRSWQQSIIAGLIKLACANGMTTLARELSLLQKHSRKLSLGLVAEMIERAMAQFNASTAQLETMALRAISQQQGANVIAYAMEKFPVISEKSAKAIHAIWANPTYKEDSARNVMNLYSSFTQYLRDEDSYMKQTNIGNVIGKMFRDAINKADFMAEILATRNTGVLIEG